MENKNTNRDICAEKTKAYIENVKKYLLDTYGTIKPSWMGIVDQLATHYNVFQMAKIGIEEYGLLCINQKGVPTPNPSIKVMNDASIQCQKLIEQLGVSPKMEIKLKLDTKTDDTEDFLEALKK